MIKVLTALLDSVKALNPAMTLFSLAATFALGLFNFFNALWAQLLAKLAAVTLPASTAASVMQGFEFCNYVFPVSELFTFGSAFLTLYLVCAAVRIVKSFVPTIS